MEVGGQSHLTTYRLPACHLNGYLGEDSRILVLYSCPVGVMLVPCGMASLSRSSVDLVFRPFEVQVWIMTLEVTIVPEGARYLSG